MLPLKWTRPSRIFNFFRRYVGRAPLSREAPVHGVLQKTCPALTPIVQSWLLAVKPCAFPCSREVLAYVPNSFTAKSSPYDATEDVVSSPTESLEVEHVA